MAIRTVIFDETLSIEGATYAILWYADSPEDEPRFRICSKITRKDLPKSERSVSHTSVWFSIRNPLDIGALAIHAAAIYGFCVGTRLARFTFTTGVNTYRASTRELLNLKPLDRGKNMVSRLRDQSTAFGNESVSALVDCLPVKIGPTDD